MIPSNYNSIHSALHLTKLTTTNRLTTKHTKVRQRGVSTIISNKLFACIDKQFESPDGRIVAILLNLASTKVIHLNIYAPANPADKVSGDINYDLNSRDSNNHFTQFCRAHLLEDPMFALYGNDAVNRYSRITHNSASRIDGHLTSQSISNLSLSLSIERKRDIGIKSDHLAVRLITDIPVPPTRDTANDDALHPQPRNVLREISPESQQAYAAALVEAFNSTRWREATTTPIQSLHQLEERTTLLTDTLVNTATSHLEWRVTGKKRPHFYAPRYGDKELLASHRSLNKQAIHLHKYKKMLQSRIREHRLMSSVKLQEIWLDLSFYSPTTVVPDDASLLDTLAAVSSVERETDTAMRANKNAQRTSFMTAWRKRLEEWTNESTTRREFFAAMKGGTTRSNIKPTLVRKVVNGIVHTIHEPAEVVSEVESYFKTLFCSDTRDPDTPSRQFWYNDLPLPTYTNPKQSTLDTPLTTIDIKNSISKLSNRKAPGRDGVYNELIKSLPPTGIQALLDIYNACLALEDVPAAWKKGTIYPVFKDGHPFILDNYRAITLLSNLYKMLTSMLTKRILHFLEYCTDDAPSHHRLSHTQFAFREANSTELPHHILSNCILDSNLFSKEMHVAFIDLRKAFDSIEHWAIREALVRKGISTKLVNLISNIMKDTTVTVITPHGLTGEIHTEKGVKQGCPLSPLLWNLFIDPILQYLTKSVDGYSIAERVPRPLPRSPRDTHVSNLAFADDLALLAALLADLQRMLFLLSAFLEYYGVEINVRKSAYACQFAPKNSNPQALVYNTPLPKLSRGQAYKYLGLLIQLSLNWAKHARYLLSKITPLLERFSRMSIHPDQLATLLNMVIVPAVMYGMGTLILSENTLKTIDCLHRKVIKLSRKLFRNTTNHLLHAPQDLFGFQLTSVLKAQEYAVLHSFYRALNTRHPLVTSTTFTLWRKLQTVHSSPDLLYISRKKRNFNNSNLDYFLRVCEKYNLSLESNHPLIDPLIRREDLEFHLPLSALSKRINTTNGRFRDLIIHDRDGTPKLAGWGALQRIHYPDLTKDSRRTIQRYVCTPNTNNILPRIVDLLEQPLRIPDPPQADELPVSHPAYGTTRVVYTDGSCHPAVPVVPITNTQGYEILTSTRNTTMTPAKAGFGIYTPRRYTPTTNVGTTDENNIINMASNLDVVEDIMYHERSTGCQTVNNAEVQGITRALLQTPPNMNVIIYTDSLVAISVTNAMRHKPQPLPFLGKGFYPTLFDLIPALHHRDRLGASTNLIKVKAHNGIRGNEMADRLAGIGSLAPINTSTSFHLPLLFKHKGTHIPNIKHFLKLEHIESLFIEWSTMSKQGQLLKYNFDRASTTAIASTLPRNLRLIQRKMFIDNGPWHAALHLVRHPDITSNICIECHQAPDTIEHVILNCPHHNAHPKNSDPKILPLVNDHLPSQRRIVGLFSGAPRPNVPPLVYHPLLTALGAVPSGLCKLLKTLGVPQKEIPEVTKIITITHLKTSHNLIVQRVTKSVQHLQENDQPHIPNPHLTLHNQLLDDDCNRNAHEALLKHWPDALESDSYEYGRMDSPITEAEIRKELRHMRKGKSPGIDGLTVEFYKANLNVLMPLLLQLFNSYLSNGVPRLAKRGVLISLYKGK
eukprot:gene16836-20020_t